MPGEAAFVRSQPFLHYLQDWVTHLPDMGIADAIPNPDRAAVVSVEVINGFCTIGPLASPRVKAIIEPVVELFKLAWDRGVRNIILVQDTHEPDALEFAQYPPHCIRGTEVSQTVPEIKALPFFDKIRIFEKNSIETVLNTGFADWLIEHPEIDTFIAVGDCTDICTYQLAMRLRMDANARQLKRRVIVPVNTVDTYDLPVEAAKKVGAMPHDADLLHAIFLYHMALNGVEVVKQIC